MAFWGVPEPAAEAAALGLPAAGTGTAPGSRLPTLPTLLPHGGSLVDADVPALLVPVGEAVGPLAALAAPGTGDADGPDHGIQPDDGAEPEDAAPALPGPEPIWSHSVRAWAVAARLALEHVTAGHLVPALREAGAGRVRAHWRAETHGDPRLTALAEALPAAAHALRFPEPNGPHEPNGSHEPNGLSTPDSAHRPDGVASPPATDATEETRVWSPLALLTAFCDAVADACARAGAPAPASPVTHWTTALT
ncbi:hypothetical protein ACSNOK_32415, partial [Streptomyces sp. URMC 126]